MTLIFTLSAVMLCPFTSKIFKAPVPHIHKSLGYLLIPWAMTYVIYLPCLYMQFTDHVMSDYLYVVVNMVSITLVISVTSWSYMNYLQQGVKQAVLQPFVLVPLVAITAAYAFDPVLFWQELFLGVCIVETVALVVYYIVLYRRFSKMLREYYSTISTHMLRSLWTQWAVSAVMIFVYVLCVIYDTMFINMLDIIANLVAVCVFVHTSENLMPLPKLDVESDAQGDSCSGCGMSVSHEIDIPAALLKHCESTELYCQSKLTLDDLALALNTNRTYLSQWFADNNTNFYKYINALRISHAATLLETTKLSINEVQIAAGFSNRTTFSKYFVECYGCSPTEFRVKGKILFDSSNTSSRN